MSDKVDFNWGSSTDVVSVEGASFNRDSELSISSVENLSMFDRSLDVVVKNEEFGLRGVITVKQERPALSYAPAVTWEGSHVVSAAGASVRPVITVTATKQGTTTVVGEEVLVPDSISTGAEWVSQEGDVFVVASRGTEEGVSRSALVHYAGVLSNGDSIEGSFLITQEANTYSVEHAGGVLTYGPVVAGEISSELVPASGGEAVATVGDGSQTWTRSAEVINHVYTSGAVEEVEVVTPAESGSISVAPQQRTFTYTFTSRGTQVSANQKFYYFPEDAQWIGEDGQSASVDVVVYQQENLRTGPRYTDITGTYSYPQAPAGGGSIVGKTSFKQYQVYDYTSGATSQSTPSGKPSITYAKISGDGTLVSTTGNTVEVPSRGTTVDTEDTVAYTGTVTISWHGVTVVWTASIIQEANIKTETLRIWGGSVDDGGLNRPEWWGRLGAGPGSNYLYMQGSWTTAYTSGVEDTVAIDPFEDLPEDFTPTVSSDATSWAVPKGIGGGGSGPYVQVMPRGTEEGAERSGSVTWELNGVTSNALTFTQVANVKTQTGLVIDAVSDGESWLLPKNWGSAPASDCYLRIRGDRQYRYSSGSTSTERVTDPSVPDFSCSISADAVSWAVPYAYNSQVGALNVRLRSRGTEIGPARTGSVTWELDGFTSNALTFTQVQNEVVSVASSAAFSYPGSVAAAGGSVSPTLSDAAVLTFTSGSKSPALNSQSSDFYGGALTFARSYTMPTTTGWTLNTDNGSLTATNNTSTSARTSGVVTSTLVSTFTNPASVGGTVVSGSGESTATASQLAGSYSYAAWVVSASANPTSIGAGGGVSTITGSASRTYGWNGATSGAGTQAGTVTYSIPATTGATLSDNKLTWASRGTTVGDARSVTVTVTCQEDKTKTATVVVSQVANEATTITYGVPSVTVSASDVPASGGSVTSGTATYSQSRTQNYTSGSTSVLSALTSGGTVTWSGGASNVASLGATEKARTAVGSPLTATVTMNGQSGTGSVTVYQAANSATTITYGDITGTFTYSSVGAGGGTSTPTVSYSQPRTQNYTSGGTSALSAVTSGATLTYAKTSGGGTLSSASTGSVSVASRGTTVDSANTTAYTGTVTIALNGKSKSVTASVTQTRNEATSITYGTPTVSLSYGTVPAGGGTVNPTLSYTQSRTQNYTSGSTSVLSAVTSGGSVAYSRTSGSATVNATSGAVAGTSRGTTVDSADTTAAVVKATVTLNSKSGEASATVSQVRNQATSITYGTPSVSVSASDVPAGGGSVTSGTATYSQSRTQNYTSGSTSALSAVTSGGSVAWSGGASGIASLGTTVKARTAVGSALTATVTLNGKSGTGSATVYQAANSATYGDLTGGAVSASDIAASGATRTATVTNMTQTVSFTSGSSRAGTVSNSQTAAITGSSLGTTIKARTKLGTITVTFTGEGSKTATKSVDVYQAENKVTAIGAVTAAFSYGSAVAAAGGSVSLTLAGGCTLVFSSGAETLAIGSSGTHYGGTLSLSRGSYTMPTTTGWSVNATSGTLTATNNTSTSARTSGAVSNTITATYTNPSTVGSTVVSKSDTKTATASQSAGYYTYSDITASMSYPATAAAGGTSTPTISFSQTYGWNGSTSGAGTVTSYSKGSFSMSASTGATLNTSTGVITWANNTSTSSRTSASVSVTLTGSGSKTKTISATATQNAGYYTYSDVTASMSYSAAAAGGATVTPTISFSQTYGWNGATSGAGTVSTYTKGTFSMTATTGATLNTSTGAVTWANNTSSSARTSNAVSVRITGSGSKYKDISATSSQNAGSYSYAAWTVALSANTTSIGAGGGAATLTSSASRTYGWNGATSGAGTQAGTIKLSIPTTTGATLSGTASGSTLTWASFGTTISNSRSVVVTATCQENTGVTQTVTITQSGNYVTAVTTTGSLSYSAVGAGGGTGSATAGGSPTFTFSSGSTSTTTPSTTYGSLSTTNAFSWSAASGNFTALNTSTGAVTVSSKGTTISNATSSPTVTLTRTVTWTPTTSYNSAGTKTGSKTATATCSQNGNYVSSLTASTGGSFSYASTHGGTVTPSASNRTLTYTFTSGSTSTTTPASTYGSLTTGSASYSWPGASGAFTALNASTGAMTVSSAGASAVSASTSPTVTRSMTYTWTPASSYNAGGTKTVTPTQTATCTRLANSLTWNDPVITFTYGDISAGGSTVTPTVSITQSGSYTNGSTTSNTTIGSKSFSGTSVNTSTGAVSGSSLGTTVKARTKITTATVSVTANSKTATKTADVYQAANAIASYKDWSDTFTLNPNIVSAGGDKVYFSGSSKGTAVYTSGSSGTAGAITSNLTGVTSGATWATVNFADGSISVSGNSGSTGRNTTITGTYANGRTKTATLTQEANIGSMYVVFHNNTAQTINWQVAFTLTLNGNYVSAYGSSAYETTMYGQQSESLSPVGEINPAAAGMTTCSQIKLTDVTVGAFRESGSMYSSQFRAWVTVEMHNASNGGDLQLSTCGTNSSPMITNGTTNTSPTSSSNVSCSPTFYTAEANRYLIHIAIG